MKKIVPIFVAFLFVTILYLLTLRGFSGNFYPESIGKGILVMNEPPFETSMERGRFAQIVSIGKQGTFNVDSYSQFLMPDLGWYSGHYYSAFPPGVALVSVPLFLVGEALGNNLLFSFLTTLFASVATGVVVYLICRRIGLTLNQALFSALIFCLASGVWAYSVTVSAHPFSALVIALMFLLALRMHKNGGFFTMFAVFALYASNFFIDYPNTF